MSYRVVIKGTSATDDGLRREIALDPDDYWSCLQTGSCPDCGGRWVWAENGNVPGTRQCESCGSLFSVIGARYDHDKGISADARGVAVLRRERLY